MTSSLTAKLLTTIAGAAFIVALDGCAVGPDFERPVAPQDAAFDSTPLKDAAATEPDKNVPPQHFAAGKDLPTDWWTLFHSQPLNDLIVKALAANPDVKAAEAALRVAEENREAEESIFFPSISGSFDTTRQKTSGNSVGGSFPGSIYTLHNATVSASYGLDVFGASRRAMEQTVAVEDYQRFQLEAAYLSLTANVVTTAIREASLRGQIDATHKIIADQSRQYDLIKQQLDAGSITRATLLQQETVLANARTALPPLEQQLAAARHQLSVYCGDTPSHDPAATFELVALDLPKDIPLSLPSQLVDQRPDIRAAEANLHEASAAVGVAEAARLPQFMLSADIGDVANNLGRMFFPGTGIWSMGIDATQVLFDAGKLEHLEDAARAQLDVAAAQYRKTVLMGYQQVADALRALQTDAESLALARAASRSAEALLTITRERFNDGATTALDLANAEVDEQQAKIAVVKAEAQRYADTAALFEALGGGWWNRQPVQNADAEPTPATVSDQPAATNTTITNPKANDLSPQPAPSLQLWRQP